MTDTGGTAASPRGRRATLADVALRAGVSPSTASRALNGRGELAPATRELVLAAAHELQFKPSVLAKSLRTKQTFTIGFVVPDISSPFYAATLRAAQRVLHNAGYQVMLINTDRSVAGEVDALETLLDHHVDGLIVATTGLTPGAFSEIVGGAVPCVFFDGILQDVGTASVGVQNAEGMATLVDHLVEHGHRRIALLAGAQTETTGIERSQGFRDAMRRHDLHLPRQYVRACDWTQECGYQETARLLALTERPTAIVAASDDMAVGSLEACRDVGVDLPDQIALVSFDDPFYGAVLEPPLTALRSRSRDIGDLSAELLVKALRGEPIGPRDVRIPVPLVRRRSCGCRGD